MHVLWRKDNHGFHCNVGDEKRITALDLHKSENGIDTTMCHDDKWNKREDTGSEIGRTDLDKIEQFCLRR